jgi:hypothetical protein
MFKITIKVLIAIFLIFCFDTKLEGKNYFFYSGFVTSTISEMDMKDGWDIYDQKGIQECSGYLNLDFTKKWAMLTLFFKSNNSLYPDNFSFSRPSESTNSYIDYLQFIIGYAYDYIPEIEINIKTNKWDCYADLEWWNEVNIYNSNGIQYESNKFSIVNRDELYLLVFSEDPSRRDISSDLTMALITRVGIGVIHSIREGVVQDDNNYWGDSISLQLGNSIEGWGGYLTMRANMGSKSWAPFTLVDNVIKSLFGDQSMFYPKAGLDMYATSIGMGYFIYTDLNFYFHINNNSFIKIWGSSLKGGEFINNNQSFNNVSFIDHSFFSGSTSLISKYGLEIGFSF